MAALNRYSVLACVFLFSPICAFGGSEDPAPVKPFVVNLDQDPTVRWKEIFEAYKYEIPAMLAILKTMVPPEVLPLAALFGDSLDTYIPQPYADEIRGLSTSSGMPLGDVALLNALYELSAFCTSIVARDTSGNMYHARNLDYGFVGLLHNITIEVDFQRSGTTVYTGTTFAGFVGLMTGQRPHVFTVSLDQRNQGAWWENLLEAVLDRHSHFAALLIRDTLEEGADFKSSLSKLAYSPLIAPCYIIVAGTLPNEAAVITRDRISAVDIWSMDNDKWYLLETNYDHWVPPPASDDRRDPGIAAMNKVGEKNISLSTLYDILSTPPVLNKGTIYTTLMTAAKPSEYKTFIRPLIK